MSAEITHIGASAKRDPMQSRAMGAEAARAMLSLALDDMIARAAAPREQENAFQQGFIAECWRPLALVAGDPDGEDGGDGPGRAA